MGYLWDGLINVVIHLILKTWIKTQFSMQSYKYKPRLQS